MNHWPCIALKRGLAMLLALVLTASLPVLAEDISLELDDAPALEVIDAGELSIDALPELSDEATLSDDIDLTLTGDDLDVDAGNTSKHITEPSYWSLKLYKDSVDTMTIKDRMKIITPKGDIASWENSNNDVASITRDGKNTLIVVPLKPGVTTMVIKLVTGKAIRFKLTIEPDPKVLTKFSFKQKNVTLYTGMDLDMMTFLDMEPMYPDWSINFTTSNREVLPFTRDCIVVARKPGKATITGVSDNGLKASMNVVVKENITEALSKEPTNAYIRNLGNMWTLQPSSLEMLGNGKVVLRLWVVNGSAGKLATLNNFDMSLYRKDDNGDTLIARINVNKIDFELDKNDANIIKITIPTGRLNCSGMNFTKLKAKDLRFQMNSAPSGTLNGNSTMCLYKPTSIPVVSAKPDTNPVKYRALLISESDFYHPDRKDKKDRWERINRNKGDLELMQNMLKRVKTPDGSRYEVTAQNNTSLSQFKQLIKKAFAGADNNDVSLFFIATHGDSDDSTPEKDTGALSMASLKEKAPEWITMAELRDLLAAVPGKVIVILESCGSGAAVKSNGDSGKEAMARAAEAFDAQVVDVFRSADTGVIEGNYAANTGDFRKVNKFYVLTASAYREESFGTESKDAGKNGSNHFTAWLTEGVGKSGSMPADEKYAGNDNDMVDLHELYRYISNVGNWSKLWISKNEYCFQHVQVYPSNLRYTLFK